MSNVKVVDQRGELPVFIHSSLDELGLTPEAFRVYCHLVRRAGKGHAFPKQQSIGDICFPRVQRRGIDQQRFDRPMSEVSSRTMAMRAIEALVEHGLITQHHRSRADNGRITSSTYELLPPSQWKSWEQLNPEPGSQGDLGKKSKKLPRVTRSHVTRGNTTMLPVVTEPCYRGDQPKGIPLEVTPNEITPANSEIFSEKNPIEETRSSTVKEAPIVETIRPTTTKGKTTPLPPSERGTLTHQALAVYAKFKPGGWVDSPTNSTALEMDILRVCQNLPSPSEFLPRIEMALKFAQDDWALKQKTGSFGDLFKFSNLIDWSDKGRKKFGDSKPTVSEEEIEARKAQADYSLRMARIRQDARDSWVNSNYSENKSAGVMAWSKFDAAQKDQIVERYITRQDQANYARLERIASANQRATAEIQEHREYAVAGGIQP